MSTAFDTTDHTAAAAAERAPALWNPLVAAGLSVVFSPVFGAAVQWRNCVASGDVRAIRRAQIWLVLCIATLLAGVALAAALPETTGVQPTQLTAFGFLLVWLVAAALPHSQWIDQRYGTRYRRKSWALPITLAALCCVAYVALWVVVALLLPAR